MKKEKIIQIGIAVKDLEKSLEFYYKTLGTGSWDIHELNSKTMREATYRGKLSDWSALVAVTWIGDRQLELMQPFKGPNVYYDFLEKNGEGIQHITFWEDDCQKSIEEYAKKGIKVIQSGKYGGGEFYYLDTEPQTGIIFEISKGGAKGKRVPLRRYPE